MEMLLGLVVMAGVPAYFVVQPATLWRWPGGWRIAALAPLLVTVPALVFSLFALVAAHADFRRGRRHALFGRAVAGAPVALRLTCLFDSIGYFSRCGLRR